MLILFDTVKLEGEEGYESKCVALAPSSFQYGDIVSAQINAHYSNDVMWAIINNLLKDIVGMAEQMKQAGIVPQASASTKSFEQMQQYRDSSKSFAREVVDEFASIKDLDEYINNQEPLE